MSQIEFLDHAPEVTPVTQIPAQFRQWLAPEIRDEDWLVRVPDAALEELQALSRFIEQNPLQNLQRDVADYAIPEMRKLMAQMKHILDDGVGFAVLDRLPVDEIALDVLVEIYWLLGQLIGRPVAQKWNGQMIYDVRDTGQQYQYGVRGSHTSVELVFHNDNAFGEALPDYVGLFCKNPARSGGVSRFCCLYTVHQRLSEQCPPALERLYSPMYFDRQKEHRDGAPPVCYAPFFRWQDGRLKARVNTSLVRKGYEVAGEDMDDELVMALDELDRICEDGDLWFEAPLQRGQVQYLNNHRVAHFRSAFVDYDEPGKKRHLFRLWHRQDGSACYDGHVGQQ